MFSKTLGLLAALALAAPAFPGTKYKFDQDASQAGWSVSHLMLGHATGTFKAFKGTFDLDLKKAEKSSVSAEFNLASVDTGIVKRDNHIRSRDFFWTEKFPKATFKSKSVAKGAEEGTYTIEGELNLRGVKKPVTLKAKLSLPADGKAPAKLAFEATGVINRMEYGVAWNNTDKTGKAVAGDEVELTFSGEAVKK